MSVCVLHSGRRHYEAVALGEGDGFILSASRCVDRRTRPSAKRQGTKVIWHVRVVVVVPIRHYDGALIGAEKDCLRWFVEGQRGALQPNRAVTQGAIVWRLYSARIIGAVLSWFRRGGGACFSGTAGEERTSMTRDQALVFCRLRDTKKIGRRQPGDGLSRSIGTDTSSTLEHL